MKRSDAFYIFMLSAMTYFIFLNSNKVEGDFQGLYQASHLFMLRLNPYNIIGYHGISANGYVYPPIAIFLTLPFSLLPYGFALLAWTFICYLMLISSIYWWHELFIEKAPELKEFVLLFIASCMAPVIWCFCLHQMTIPVLFFSTLTIYLLTQAKHPWSAGIVAGFLLIKPHLTLPLLLLLAIRTSYKRQFWIGFLLCSLLPFLPFLTGYRPIHDLVDWTHATKHHGWNLYSRDEQGIPSQLYKTFNYEDCVIVQRINTHDRANIMIQLPFVEALNRFKLAAFGITLVLWGVYILGAKRISWAHDSALALAIGLLFSSYSHFYDGVMLLPICLLTLLTIQKEVPLEYSACFLFCLCPLMTYVLPFSIKPDFQVFWDRTRYVSIFYSALFLVSYYFFRSEHQEPWTPLGNVVFSRKETCI